MVFDEKRRLFEPSRTVRATPGGKSAVRLLCARTWSIWRRPATGRWTCQAPPESFAALSGRAGRRFVSCLSAGGPKGSGRVFERFGPVCVEMKHTIVNGRLLYPVRRGTILGLPLPDVVLPRSGQAHECVDELGTHASTCQSACRLPDLSFVTGGGSCLLRPVHDRALSPFARQRFRPVGSCDQATPVTSAARPLRISGPHRQPRSTSALPPVRSTGHRNTLAKSLCRGLEVQRFSGSLIELARDLVELGLGVGSEIDAARRSHETPATPRTAETCA